MSRRRTWYQNLKALAEHRESPAPYAVNGAETDEQKKLFLDELQKRFTIAGLLINGHLINIVTYSFDQELQFYEQASLLAPGNRTVQRLKSLAESRATILRAEAAFSKKQYSEAAALYEHALSVNPDPADDSAGHSLFMLGAIHAMMGKPEQAERMIEQCLSIFPTHKRALMLGANLARKTGHAERAALRIKRLKFLYPYDAEVRSLDR